MDIRSKKEADATLVTVTGRMEVITDPAALHGEITGGESRFVVDMGGLEGMRK